jgi:crotonobetainyl-CoA:carnitine CoA-transferase CaiB-like acyl-CoA transferase
MARFDARDVWCAEVLQWGDLVEHQAFAALDPLQVVTRPSGASFQTLRCPIRIDGQALRSPKWAPVVGEDNRAIDLTFGLRGAEGTDS